MWLFLRFVFNSLQYGVKHQLLSNDSTDSCLTVLEGRTKENQDRIILSWGNSPWNIYLLLQVFSLLVMVTFWGFSRVNIDLKHNKMVPTDAWVYIPKTCHFRDCNCALSFPELQFNQGRVIKCFSTCSWEGYFNQKQTFN